MALNLITGPANAEKARAVLDAYSAAIERDPILVVPTQADVNHYRRELAARGVVFGADVRVWRGLASELARRAGVRRGPLGEIARRRIAALAVSRTKLRVLGASAATPGFVRALLALCDELEQARIDPARWYGALRAWAEEEAGRSEYAEDLADLYGAYRRALERHGRLDAPLHAIAANDALRLRPAAWGATPVFLYGFDDLTALQLDAIDTLAGRCGTDVTVSLPHEAGRVAFAGRAGTHQELLAIGAQVSELGARAEHYEAVSRAALHHIERNLFEGHREPGPAPDPAGAVALLQGGGQRAELELVAAAIAALIEEGTPPAEIAVVLRAPHEHAALVEDVFAENGVPVNVARRTTVAHTALGRGVLSLIRCALMDGSADDLVTWLRTPGHVHQQRLVDDLEAAARQRGARRAEQAREIWEDNGGWPLQQIDRVKAAAGAGPVALCERLAAEAQRLQRAPHAGSAAVLGVDEQIELAAGGRLRAALGELAGLAAADADLVPAPGELITMLGDIEVTAGSAQTAAVTVADPLALRARRVRALFACCLQERSFPQPGRPEPFLGDAERRAINSVAGTRLMLNEDRLGAERYLFYAVASRPTAMLTLSWHDSDDDGAPVVRSLFVDDVLDLFGPELAASVRRRELGAAGDAGSAHPLQAARAAALAAPDAPPGLIAPLRDERVLGALAARETWSASALEAWVSCPVRWFVEKLLHPEPLSPDPEPMVRGTMAHAVLEDTLRELSAEFAGPLRPEHLPRAQELAVQAIEHHRGRHRISADPQRLMAELHRLEADVIGYLQFAAHNGSRFHPDRFELRFGEADDDLPAVQLTPALRLKGRVDRVDRSEDGAQAIVYDYKGASGTPFAAWPKKGRLQLALYMLALPQLIDAEVVGGLYQPLRNRKDSRPRGLLRDDADPGLQAVKTDRADAEKLQEALDLARDTAAHAVDEIREGRLQPCPGTCAWDGGCAYPSICRAEA